MEESLLCLEAGHCVAQDASLTGTRAEYNPADEGQQENNTPETLKHPRPSFSLLTIWLHWSWHQQIRQDTKLFIDSNPSNALLINEL